MMVPGPIGNNHDLLGPGRHHRVGPGGAAIQAMGNININIPKQNHAPSTPTGDLLGFETQQPQQSQEHVMNANQVTVSITTSGDTAPSIAGIGKISAQSSGNVNAKLAQPKRKVIYVPTYSCNGGLDTKVSYSLVSEVISIK